MPIQAGRKKKNMTNYDNRLADYVDVAERIRIFRDRYPDGSLQPLNHDKPFDIITIDGKTIIVYIAAAYRFPDDPRPGIGIASEPFPGLTPYSKNSEIMVAETSAWGRAIVAALAADSKRIASLDEVRARREAENTGHPSAQAQETRQERPQDAEQPRERRVEQPASEAQEKALYALSKKLGKLPPVKGSLSKVEAMKKIEELKALEASETDSEEPF